MSKHPSYIPSDIVDSIVDLLHDDREALKRCSLISTPWVPRTRKHLFNEVKFDSPSRLSAWKKTFPDPAKSPAQHARSLIVRCADDVTAEVAKAEDWIRSFTNVVRLDVSGCGTRINFTPFHVLSSVQSLRVAFGRSRPPETVVEFICSFHSLKDLGITNDGRGVNEAIFQPSASPPFTGTLTLSGGLEPIEGVLSALPGRLRFREIVWNLPSKDELGRLTALVEMYSDTLECISIGLAQFDDLQTASIGLSRATKLREVSFQIDGLFTTQWIIAAVVKAITSGHEHLQRISIHFSLQPFDPPISFELAIRLKKWVYLQWLDLDTDLVKLRESGAIHMRASTSRMSGQLPLCKRLMDLLPEATKRGLIDGVHVFCSGNECTGVTAQVS